MELMIGQRYSYSTRPKRNQKNTTTVKQIPTTTRPTMCARVQLIYNCFHHLSLEGEEIPYWVVVELQSGGDFENSSYSVNDICMACKEDMNVREERRKAWLAMEKKQLTEKSAMVKT